ncbi:Ppx/GppA phosphatase family protein [Cohnella candidum]|uniref:Ppx/GppA family phosphatase n=1 Tax=Cohnella candidum TaxID=2674991 RepID=A0A3G3JTB9_9BACL|nr:Ppx/GppA phosphatase family protein [Cohnella candidum]AYQ71470.1 Ppx/GppA family phosphatase [Cohnella candidum]
MKSSEVTGIIDIGSNTVRLAVFQVADNGARRIVDQGRWPARLSRRLTPDGRLPDEAVSELAEVLKHYVRICRMHGTQRIRAVATAAVRAASNREDVIRRLCEATGLRIEVLSGEEEAHYGSQAMLRTLDMADGFVVDIGGGSTEITLLRDRKKIDAVSFPVGCVNLANVYGLNDGPVPSAALDDIRSDVRRLLASKPWISGSPGLPLIGLGGTVRAFAKFRQRETDYPFPLLHGYEQSESELAASLDKLAALPVAGRRKLPGLSKDRADVIVPGLAILQAVMRHTGASRLTVCGTGIRDGLFFETCPPAVGEREIPVLEESIRNLNALYPTAPEDHLEQVRKLAAAVYDCLNEDQTLPGKAKVWLDTAARLYKIGAAIDLNDCADHTFYMLMHTHWNGLSHREILLTAATASFRGINALKRNLAPYRPILEENDTETAAKLGSLLQLAIALDRSESQSIRSLSADAVKNKLVLTADAEHALSLERMEVESLSKDFKKIWGLTPVLYVR